MGAREAGRVLVAARSAVRRSAPGPDRGSLERLYAEYNDRRFIHTDPVAFVHRYDGQRDREVVALVASSLAFGTVKQIKGSVERVLAILGADPADRVTAAAPPELAAAFKGFRHRWITGEDVAALLAGAGAAMREHGSLGGFFRSKLEEGEIDMAPAAGRFARALRDLGGEYRRCLLPSPESGSACKRLNLFLRWMVRSDEVDPGGWNWVSPSMLLVPLDTHMHRFALRHGLTSRRAADLAAAREVTAAFGRISPEDPVKYDFALTRLGMLRKEADKDHAGLLG